MVDTIVTVLYIKSSEVCCVLVLIRSFFSWFSSFSFSLTHMYVCVWILKSRLKNCGRLNFNFNLSKLKIFFFVSFLCHCLHLDFVLAWKWASSHSNATRDNLTKDLINIGVHLRGKCWFNIVCVCASARCVRPVFSRSSISLYVCVFIYFIHSFFWLMMCSSSLNSYYAPFGCIRCVSLHKRIFCFQ